MRTFAGSALAGMEARADQVPIMICRECGRRSSLPVTSTTEETGNGTSNSHARALNILEKTGDIRQVALWLGHASQQTTEVLLPVDPAEKLRILSADEAPVIGQGSFP